MANLVHEGTIKNLQKLTTLLPHYMETIQVEHPIIIVVSFFQVDCMHRV